MIKEGVEYQYEENEFDKERFTNVSAIGADVEFDILDDENIFQENIIQE